MFMLLSLAPGSISVPLCAPMRSTGGLPMILPKLAADYSAMLDGARNIKYDGRALATAGPAAAAAAGWSAGRYGDERAFKASRRR